MTKYRKDVPCLECKTVDGGHETTFYYAGHWWRADILNRGKGLGRETSVYWLRDDRVTVYRKTKFKQRSAKDTATIADTIRKHVSAFMDWFDEFHRKKGPTWKPDF